MVMKNRKIPFSNIFVAVAFFLAAMPCMNAQEINPTVEVSRRFEASLKEIHKSYMKPVIPDSLLMDGVDFSYSVFGRKYGAGDDFVPRRFGAVNLPDGNKEPVFVLNVGGGVPWASYASLDLAITCGKDFYLTVYGDHDGYFGRLDRLSVGDYGEIVRTGLPDDSMLMSNNAGVSGGYAWKGGRLHFMAGYDGIMSENESISRRFNSFVADFGIVSHRDDDDYFYYDINAHYGYADDWIVPVPATGHANAGIKENSFDFTAVIGPVFKRYHRITADISLEFAKYDDYRSLMLFNVGFTPQYRYARDRWNIGAGIRFSKAFVQETAMPGVAPSGVNATGWIFPAVDVSFEAVRGYLWLNAAVDGGNAVNLYSDAVGRYPYLYPSGNTGTAFTDFTVIPYRMSFSIAGNVKSRFSYDLYLRYGKVEGLPAFAMDGDCPYLTYTLSSGLFTAGASLSWKSERVEAHAGVEYDDYSVTSADRGELLPPAFKGSASVEYNWRKRFFISVGADFSGEWGSVAYKVPGWVDLHVGAEYCFSKKFSVFLSAGNLLNDSIQFQPLQALPGINFMAGVCLKL